MRNSTRLSTDSIGGLAYVAVVFHPIVSAMKRQGNVVPVIRAKPAARYGTVDAGLASSVPPVPCAGGEMTMRAEHVFLAADELEGVELQRLRVLLSVGIDVQPEYERRVR